MERVPDLLAIFQLSFVMSVPEAVPCDLVLTGGRDGAMSSRDGARSGRDCAMSMQPSGQP